MWLRNVLFLSLVLSAHCSRSAEEAGENEIGEEYRYKARNEDGQDYDPSFLDEILGADYFEENTKSKEKTKYEVTVPEEEPKVVAKKGHCTGCAYEVDVESDKVREVATYAFDNYATTSSGDDDAAQMFVRVVKAQTQVVSGQKYILQIEAGYLNCSKSVYAASPEQCALDSERETFFCDFEVVERVWEKSKEVVRSECRDTNAPVVEDATDATTVWAVEEETTMYPMRRKRETPAMPGHELGMGKLREANESKEELMEMAAFAVNQLDEIDADDEARFAVEVLKAKKQTVSGWLYHLKIRVAQTSCKENKGAKLDDCKDKVEMPLHICDVKVLFQPWQEMKKKVTESQCYPEKLKKSKKLAKKLFGKGFVRDKRLKSNQIQKDRMVGGPTVVDTTSPELQDLVSFGLARVDAQSNALHAQKVVDVVHAERQVVNGIITKITFEAGFTKCRKSPNLDMSKCDLDEEREHNFCEIHVWEKPWMNFKEVTKSKCGKREEIMKRIKRSLLGSDGQDYRQQKERIMNGGTQDYSSRKKPIGGDDHDYKPHGERLIGGGSHDYSAVKKRVIGGDNHDYQPHEQKPERLIGGDSHDYSTDKKRVIGGDNHDYQPHEQKPERLIGGGTHDYSTHGKHLLGSGDHDYRPHSDKLIGAGTHDYSTETKPILGGDDHDYKPHSERLIGGGSHDYSVSSKPLYDDEGQAYTEEQINEFHGFLGKYNKKYPDQVEYKYRLKVFHENMKKVKLLQENEQGTATYGATIFADLTEEEFSARHLGLRPELRIRSKVKKAKIPPIGRLPDEFDWRHYNTVTPVKNQGSCGSCWAFSVTGNIEGLYARKHGQLLSFSEQELVDCDTLDSGCGGGLPENAYKALQKIGGLEPESAYPYDGKNEKCHFKQGLATAKVTGFVEVSKNETEMAAWLVKNGPISIGINANAMQFYFGGVSHPWKYLCSPKALDHGVLIVGYGVHTTSIRHKVMPYWLVKNSWGPSWGEQGYYRVYRGDGTCGINQMATSAVIE